MSQNLNRFTIIFKKLEEHGEEANSVGENVPQNASADEMDEIAELRRIVHEVTEPEQFSYTTT